MISNMFKIPKYKVFNYSPIFYDEQKEDLKKRMKDLEGEFVENKEYRPNIRGKMRQRMHRDSYQNEKKSLKRPIIIITNIFLLIIIFYMIADYFPNIIF